MKEVTDNLSERENINMAMIIVIALVAVLVGIEFDEYRDIRNRVRAR